MVKSNNNQITISVAMANCIKQLIFSETKGVNLTPIVEDIEGDDMTAVAVALAYKGIKPEIDTTTRFEFSYQNTYYKNEFVHYSLIKDMVTHKQTRITWNTKTNHWDEYVIPTPVYTSLASWLKMTTSEEDCIAKCPDVKDSNVGEESHTVLRVSPKD